MTIKQIADLCDAEARKEIETFGLPTLRHYTISMEAGIKLSERLGADVDIVRAGVALMDIKLGQSAKEGRQSEHVAMSSDYSKELFEKWGVDDEVLKATLINCVEAHHGKQPFKSLEAEVVANADCYRFIHPAGVMSFHATVVKRGKNHNDGLKTVKGKLEEKHTILSLSAAKEELLPYYDMFTTIINNALDNLE